MPNKENRTIAGEVTFVQNALPALEAGEYELTITQTIKGAHGKNAVDDALVRTERFTVRGERFKLDPGELHSIFPPENASGEYAAVLPHAVFARATLPWERSPFAAGRASQEVGENVPSWLAVLTVDDGDLAEFPGFDPEPRTVTVGDLFRPALGGRLSCFGAHAPEDELDHGESTDDPCSVLDMPLGLFRAVAPTIEDLALLAHVRTVSVENQDQTPGEEDAGERFSVVIGNRLPTPERRTYAYLVSLEGLGGHLPGTGDRSTGDGEVRLIVLKRWTFIAVDQEKPGADFVKILKSVDVGVLAKKPERAGGSSEDPESDAAVEQALALGYVPLAHDMRGGSLGVSWYRGPLQPNAKSRGLTVPLTSADKATRYDPDSGLFDVSYSAAWQLGRLLALEDKAYSSALYAWKREVEQQLVAEASGDAAHAPFGPILEDEPPSELQSLLVGALKEELA